MYSAKSKSQHISLLFPKHLSWKVSKKWKISSVVKLDFELKIQKQNSHLRFVLIILIHIDSVFRYTSKSQKTSISNSYSLNTAL